MKLSQLKALLPTVNKLAFKLDNGQIVPSHFHITEMGLISKKYIDCGGTLRSEEFINFQIWTANDVEHQLLPEKLLKIIAQSEITLNLEDAEIEVEYQNDTIGKYNLAFDGTYFILQSTKTACLAMDNCMVSPIQVKQKINLADLQKVESCCSTISTKTNNDCGCAPEVNENQSTENKICC